MTNLGHFWLSEAPYTFVFCIELNNMLYLHLCCMHFYLYLFHTCICIVYLTCIMTQLQQWKLQLVLTFTFVSLLYDQAGAAGGGELSFQTKPFIGQSQNYPLHCECEHYL